ncbi:MAG: hypothetical protein ABEN55_12490 [Bradymonadaceae bacterium]
MTVEETRLKPCQQIAPSPQAVRAVSTAPVLKTAKWGRANTGNGWGTIRSATFEAETGEAIWASAYFNGGTDCGKSNENAALCIVVDGTTVGRTHGGTGTADALGCTEAMSVSGMHVVTSSGKVSVEVQTADAPG